MKIDMADTEKNFAGSTKSFMRHIKKELKALLYCMIHIIKNENPKNFNRFRNF